MKLQIGLVGLGKMGYNLALNMKGHGYQMIAQDVNAAFVEQINKEGGIVGVNTPEQMCAAFSDKQKHRVIWLMVPSGKVVDIVIDSIVPHLKPGDIIIDGGNSNFNDSVRRYTELKEKNIAFLDCGTSGGMTGALHGACTMIGGDAEVFAYVESLFKDISVKDGYLYCGASGSGHFCKMVHNGIEYGMMQAMAEGFEVLEHSKYDFHFENVARVWNHGSVVRSWLMELAQDAFSKDAKLKAITGIMNSSGEGRWTLDTAMDMGIATPVIALSLLMRYRSQQTDTFSGKVVAALRNEFGGHAVVKKEV